MKNKTRRVAALAGLLVVLFGPPTRAALYPFTDSGQIPQADQIPFWVEHVIGGEPSSITSIALRLTFADSTSLSGNINHSGIQGHLVLGTGETSPYVNFYPFATSSSGSQRIYDVTFSGASGSPGIGFNGLNPNSTWGLLLWDNHTGGGLENGLVGWSLDINPVPEPVNVALAVFAALAVGIKLVSWRRKLSRTSPAA